MVFDGIDDYVKVDDAIGDLGSTFSISAWVYRASLTASGAYLLEARGDGGGGTGYAYFGASSATLGVSSGTVYVDGSVSDSVSADNKWHHIVITGMTVNIDEDIRFGARYNSTQFFDGIYNSISIWNKTLSLSEIQTIFNNGIEYDVRDTDLGYNTTYGSSNLKGFWRNDGASTWTDLSGNTSSDGDVSGSPDTILLPEGTTSGKDILGFPLTHTNNGWLNLDELEYVNVPQSSPLEFGTGNFSVECWMKTTDSASTMGLVSYGDRNDGAGWSLIKDVTNCDFYIDDGSTQVGTEGTSNVTDGDWHHIVVSVDKSANQILYVDKVAEDNDDVTGVGNIDTNDVDVIAIGRYHHTDAWFRYFNGSIDEVKIYNKALSSAEVTKNYNHGKSKHS
jgi:hypothetical protein